MPDLELPAGVRWINSHAPKRAVRVLAQFFLEHGVFLDFLTKNIAQHAGIAIHVFDVPARLLEVSGFEWVCLNSACSNNRLALLLELLDSPRDSLVQVFGLAGVAERANAIAPAQGQLVVVFVFIKQVRWPAVHAALYRRQLGHRVVIARAGKPELPAHHLLDPMEPHNVSPPRALLDRRRSCRFKLLLVISCWNYDVRICKYLGREPLDVTNTPALREMVFKHRCLVR